MQTNEQFNLALNILQNTGMNLFLTGKAGTGKTTFLKSLKHTLSKRMIVVAPTGIAAINADGVTIHSFFQLPFSPYIPGIKTQRKDFKNQFRKEKINIIRSLDLLVIDEISMVRSDVLDAISDVLCRYKDHDKPFGGVQLLMIGDLQQLAPVVKNDEWNILKTFYSSPYFFDSKALSNCSYFCIELTQIFRQNNTEFVNLLNKIRNNQFDDATLAALNKRYIPDFKPKEKNKYITLTTHNLQAQQINSNKLTKLKGKSIVFSADIEGDFPEYSYPTEKDLTLKLGAQVMFVKNDSSPDKSYFNGKIGEITQISPKNIEVTDEEGNAINVNREQWENIKYTINAETKEIEEEVTGTFTQYPLKTAWAITIHKSQGLTFEHAIIDAAAAFSHGQVYVALSRCKSLDGLVLNSPITRNGMIIDERVDKFINATSQRQPNLTNIRNAEKEYFIDLLTELFDFRDAMNEIQHITFMLFTSLNDLYPAFTSQCMVMKQKFHDNIVVVGERFILQLHQMVDESSDFQHDDAIQDRIRKSVPYFHKQIDDCLPLLTKISNIDIDNKDTRKAFSNSLEKIFECLLLKMKLLSVCNERFDVGSYLTERAKSQIDDETPYPMQETKTKAEPERKQKAKEYTTSDITHPELFEELREWRNDMSKIEKIPAYMVLQQKSLIAIVNELPTTTKALEEIPGLGKKKIEKYGAEILDLVLSYTE
jgi:energy-coupling factor transporter ATP-binding protein EcfA2